MSQDIQVNISPDTYLRQLQQTLATHVADLRHTLRALEDGSFLARAAIPRSDTVVQFRIDPGITQIDDAHKLACSRCFLDMIRSLITYIDRTIAIQRCAKDSIEMPASVQTPQDLLSFLEKYIEEAYQKIASDTSLTNPKKIAKLAPLPEFSKKATLSYFSLRRCLEHHGGIPSSDLTIYFMKPTVLAGTHEITSLPFQAAEPTKISIRIDQTERVFPRRTQITLTEIDIDNLFFTIQAFVGPDIRRALNNPR